MKTGPQTQGTGNVVQSNVKRGRLLSKVTHLIGQKVYRNIDKKPGSNDLSDKGHDKSDLLNWCSLAI